jgi:hypothetical protein
MGAGWILEALDVSSQLIADKFTDLQAGELTGTDYTAIS